MPTVSGYSYLLFVFGVVVVIGSGRSKPSPFFSHTESNVTDKHMRSLPNLPFTTVGQNVGSLKNRGYA